MSAGGSAGDSGGTLEGKGQGLGDGDGVGGGGWYMQLWRAGDTGSGSGPANSGPCIERSQVQEYRQPPSAPPSPGHTVLTGLHPPISAEGDPH